MSLRSGGLTSSQPAGTLSESLLHRFQTECLSPRTPGRQVFEVMLEKDAEHGLGLTIVGGESTSELDLGIFIKSLTPGGPAARCGLLRPGDRLIAIQGVSLEGVQHTEAVRLIRTAPSTVILTVSQIRPPASVKRPSPDRASQSQSPPLVPDRHGNGSYDVHSMPRLHLGDGEDLAPPSPFRGDDGIDGLGDVDLLNSKTGALDDVEVEELLQKDFEAGDLSLPVPVLPRVGGSFAVDRSSRRDLALENQDDVDSELGSYLGLEGDDVALALSQDGLRQTPPSKPPRKKSPQSRAAGLVARDTPVDRLASPRSAGTEAQPASSAGSRLGAGLAGLGVGSSALHDDRNEEEEEDDLEALQILGEIADQTENESSSDSDFEDVVQAAIEGKPRVRRSADDNFGDGYVDKLAKDGDTALIEMTIDKENASLGFTITGGLDSRLKEGGVYVKSVLPNSRAAQLGVQRGDRLLSVGGVPLTGIRHSRAVEVLRAAPSRVSLTLQRGLYPPSDPLPPSSPDLDSLPDLDRAADRLGPRPPGIGSQQPYSFVRPDNTFEVTLQRGSSGLGFSFQGGYDFREEVEVDALSTVPRIKKIFPIGPAADSGRLRPGDVILEVNRRPLRGLSCAGIMEALRTQSREVTLLICRPDPSALPPLAGYTSEDSLESLFRQGAGVSADTDLHLYDSDSSHGNTMTPPSQDATPRSSQEASPRSTTSQDLPPSPSASPTPQELSPRLAQTRGHHDGDLQMRRSPTADERIPSPKEDDVIPMESALKVERSPDKKDSPQDKVAVVEEPISKVEARKDRKEEMERRMIMENSSGPTVTITRDASVESLPFSISPQGETEWDFTPKLATPPMHKPPPPPSDDDEADEEVEPQTPQISPRRSKNEETACTPSDDSPGVLSDSSYQFDRASQRSLHRQKQVSCHEDEGQGGVISKVDINTDKDKTLGSAEPAEPATRVARASGTASDVARAVESASGTETIAHPELPVEPQELTVTLEKSDVGSLGFTVAGGAHTTGGCYIKGIIGNPALSDGRLQPGDRLIRVNDTDMTGLSHTEAVSFLRQAPTVVKIEVLRFPLKLPKLKSGSTESSGATPPGKSTEEVKEVTARSLESSPRKDESPSESVSRPPQGPSPQPSPAPRRAAARGVPPPPDAPPLPPSAAWLSRPPEARDAGKAVADCSDPEEEEESVHQITLARGSGGDLGFTLVTAEQDGEPGCYVRSMAAQGPAEKDGRLMVGDKIIKVNGMPVTGLRRQQVLAKLQAQPGKVHFTVLRNENEDDMPVIVESDSDDDAYGEAVREEDEDEDDDDIDALAAQAAQYLHDVDQLSVQEAKMLSTLQDENQETAQSPSARTEGEGDHSSAADLDPSTVPGHITEAWLRLLPLLQVEEGSQERMMELLQGLTEMVEEDLPAEEFQALRQLPATDESEFAKRPENRPKNRYRNVLPYDKDRVVLSGEDSYINASRISTRVGQESLQYLACQGPLPNTAEDFWRLVWESGTDVIAMLTLDMEARKVKCHRYWPDTPHKPLDAGDLSVCLKRVQKLEHFDVRYLVLKDYRSGEERELVHVNYTTWPDHGVPETALPLLQYLRLVHLLHKTGPIIVHCSAGIGRTGVFIAIDTALHHIEKDLKFYICNIVTDMRKQRYGMVQTKDQYLFCYTAVMEALLSVAD